jgi:hypothetical protein
MASEIEMAGLASLGGVATKQKADLSGRPCLNCGAVVDQRFCTNCGQLAASFHRPIWSLISETITDTLALDGRLSRTMPKLLLRPGALTKAYISGTRARYVPPFRLFLLASLIFYFVLFAIIGNATWLDDLKVGGFGTASQHEEVLQPEGGPDVPAPPDAAQIIDADGHVDRELIKKALADGEDGGQVNSDVVDRAADAYENPKIFLLGLEKWAPRLSVLLVPSTILALVILHFWRRKIYVYDHAIHALHLHTWLYLGGSLAMVTGLYISAWTAWAFLILAVLYVWRSLAVVGETGFFMSFLRLLNLLFTWIIMGFVLALTSVILGAIAA